MARWVRWNNPTIKPPFGARIDWSNPITKDLVCCALFHNKIYYNLARIPYCQLSTNEIRRSSKSDTVNARQGYTTDGIYHYCIFTTAIYKYDSDWNLLTSNTSPFPDSTVDHLGDGQYYNGKLYIPVSYWDGTTANNEKILVFDADSLSLLEYYDIESVNPEASGLTIDENNDRLVTVAYCTSRYTIFKLSDFPTVTVIDQGTLPDGQVRCQGVFWKEKENCFYVTVHVENYENYIHLYNSTFSDRINRFVVNIGSFQEIEGIDYSIDLRICEYPSDAVHFCYINKEFTDVVNVYGTPLIEKNNLKLDGSSCIEQIIPEKRFDANITFISKARYNSLSSGTNGLISIGDVGEDINTNYSGYLALTDTKVLRTFWEYGDGSNVLVDSVVSLPITSGKWFSSGITRNGTTVNFFYNGNRIDTQIAETLPESMCHKLVIGATRYDAEFWDGDIEYAYVFLRELSSLELKQLYYEPYSFFLYPQYWYLVDFNKKEYSSLYDILNKNEYNNKYNIIIKSEKNIKYDLLAQNSYVSKYDILTKKETNVSYDILAKTDYNIIYDILSAKEYNVIYNILGTSAIEYTIKYDILNSAQTNIVFDILNKKEANIIYDILTKKETTFLYDIINKKEIKFEYDILATKLHTNIYNILTKSEYKILYNILSDIVIKPEIVFKLDKQDTIFKVGKINTIFILK